MSEEEGRMAIQIGSQFLQRSNGSKGILLTRVTGVSGKVTIIGGGVVGINQYMENMMLFNMLWQFLEHLPML